MLTGIGIGSIAITIAMIVYDIRDKKQKKDQKKQKYDGFSHEFHEIERALRKRKIQLKRERARNRNYR